MQINNFPPCHVNLEYLHSVEGDDALATELKDEHEDEDDEERMEDGDLEDVEEAKVSRRLRRPGIHRRQRVEVVAVKTQDLLEWIFKITNNNNNNNKQ